MLTNIQLLTRLSEPAQLVDYEQLGSSEEEELHGSAPDQEETRVSHSSHFIMSEEP